MSSMFKSCSELEYLDLSNFDTSNVTDIKEMFSGCNRLKEIKGLNHFNTTKVEDMSFMFESCFELECLDLSNFNTINVSNLCYMRSKCIKLKDIKGINYFNTNSAINMEGLFFSCSKLEYLDLSKVKLNPIPLHKILYQPNFIIIYENIEIF